MSRTRPEPRLRSEPADGAGTTRNISPSPHRNLHEWNRSGHRYRGVEQAVAVFRAALTADLGPAITPSQTALAASAVALYTGVLLAQHRLLAARNRANRLGDLLDMLPALTGALQRTLRALGAAAASIAGDPGDAGKPRSLAEWTQRWQARKAAETQATDGEPLDAPVAPIICPNCGAALCEHGLCAHCEGCDACASPQEIES